MKFPLFLAMIGLASTAQAAVLSFTDSTTTIIPDGSSSGVVRGLVVSTGGQSITGVEVDVGISTTPGGASFLGDLYLYLSNGTESAILANRPGRSAGFPAGYADNQSMFVTFSSGAVSDFHNYRVSVTGSNAIPLGGTLTGTWQPDGRMVDPGTVLDTSPRTAGLDTYTGDAADGTWYLFAADLSTGGTHQITSWTLRLDVVPEPSSATLLASLVLVVAMRRSRTSR